MKFTQLMLRWPTLLIASCLHFVWGVLLVLDPAAERITVLTPLADLYSPVVGLALLAFAMLGFWSITRPVPSWHTLAALMPQQTVLIMSSSAALYYAVVGHYGDGVIRPHAFILADQVAMVLLTVAHSIVLVVMHVGYVGRRHHAGQGPLPPEAVSR